MAYEPTVWSSGDTVTAEKLNKIEQGIVNGADIKTNISNPVDGQIMKYDAAKGKWVNAEAPSGGSETLVVHITETTEGNNTTYTLDKTWQEIYDAFMNCSVVYLPGENQKKQFILSSIYCVVENKYVVKCVTSYENNNQVSWSALVLSSETPTGYPSYTESIT